MLFKECKNGMKRCKVRGVRFQTLVSAIAEKSCVAAPKASPKVLRRVLQPHPQLGPKLVRPAKDDGITESSSGESLTAHLASVGRKANGIWTRPLSAAPETEEHSSSSENEGSVWDDDFAEAPDLKRLAKGE
jgi:hypothetical protein